MIYLYKSVYAYSLCVFMTVHVEMIGDAHLNHAHHGRDVDHPQVFL